MEKTEKDRMRKEITRAYHDEINKLYTELENQLSIIEQTYMDELPVTPDYLVCPDCGHGGDVHFGWCPAVGNE